METLAAGSLQASILISASRILEGRGPTREGVGGVRFKGVLIDSTGGWGVACVFKGLVSFTKT